MNIIHFVKKRIAGDHHGFPRLDLLNQGCGISGFQYPEGHRLVKITIVNQFVHGPAQHFLSFYSCNPLIGAVDAYCSSLAIGYINSVI